LLLSKSATSKAASFSFTFIPKFVILDSRRDLEI
jgi:hypothetical protein